MFKTRMEMIAYVLFRLTGASVKECEKSALAYKNKSLIIKWTLD